MRSRIVVLATLLFLGSLSEVRLSAFAQPAARSVTETASTSDSEKSFFGVMGQIARPGVYELPTARPRLTEVVGRAGGLAVDASRTIRVVRDGRIAFQTYYTPRLTLTLLPGDLLLVDRSRTDYRHGSDKVRSARRIGSRASRSHTAAESQIEVAFVGLIDRPVVLRLRERDATLGRVVELLKQPATVIKTIRLIPPPQSRLKNHSTPPTPETRLHPGSVVVFSRARLDTTRIPPLPKPIRRENSSSTSMQPHSRVGIRAPSHRNSRHAIGHDVTTGRTGVIPASGERPTTSADPTALKQKKSRVRDLLKSARADLQQGRYDAARRKVLAAQREGIAFTLHEDRPELMLAEIARRTIASGVRKTAGQPASPPAIEDRSNGPVLIPERRTSDDSSPGHSSVTLSGRNVPQRLSQLPPPKSAYMLNDKPHSSQPSAADAALPAANGTEALIPSADRSDTVGSSPEADATSKPNQSAAGPVLLFVLGCGVLAVGLAAVFLISMARAAVKTMTTERARTGNDEALEALIHNTISIREEEVELPAELTLHGRPTGLRKLRIDAGRVQLRGPHFAVTADNAAATGGMPAPTGLRVDPPQQSVTNDETAGRRREPLGPPQCGPVQRDLLDRILSTVNKVTDV